MARQPGEWIHGKYRVETVLGAGGMGTVYATRRRNESPAAVKVLHPRFARDKGIRARFLEEGYLANQVQHPAVVTILEDDIDEEGNFYLVMELLDGVDLGRFTGGATRLTTVQVLEIAEELLSALVAAHRKGIIHRDIKPQNVMVLTDGRVKLLDFGIAKALGAGELSDEEDDFDEEDEEEPGEVLGTDRYMSPEQGQGLLSAIDARTDIWAIGALMFALMVGEDDSVVPLWDQSYEDRAWQFSRLGKDVPPKVVQIISLALQPKKEDRFSSAEMMLREVSTVREEMYGPSSRGDLAVVAGGAAEDAVGVPSSRDPLPSSVHNEATEVSRPSHAAPLPSATTASSPSASSDESSPESTARSGPVPPPRGSGRAALMGALGATAVLLIGGGLLWASQSSRQDTPTESGPEQLKPASPGTESRSPKPDANGPKSDGDEEETASASSPNPGETPASQPSAPPATTAPPRPRSPAVSIKNPKRKPSQTDSPADGESRARSKRADCEASLGDLFKEGACQ